MSHEHLPGIRRLSVGDLSNFWAESPTTPMQIALVGVLEMTTPSGSPGDFPIERMRAEIERRLTRVPELRQRVRETRPGQGLPFWSDDPGFDISRHVGHFTLPSPADDRAFMAWCAQRAVAPLDRDRPLWRLDFITGLETGRVGVLIVLHHAVADGIAGVSLISKLLDLAPDGEASMTAWRPQPTPTSLQLVWNNLAERARAVLTGLRGLWPTLRGAWGSYRTLASDLRANAPTTSLARPIGPSRQVAVIVRSLESLKAAGRPLGATANDVLLAAVATGLRDLFLSRGESVSGVTLRVSVPVAVRTSTGPNQNGIMLVPLPLESPDPMERFRAIASATQARKAARGAGQAASMNLPFLPLAFSRWWVRWLREYGRRKVNLFVTNVPGPTEPLWLGGARLIAAVPLGPLVAGVPLSVAALSYHGKLAVALQVDDAMPDLPVLAEGVERGFDELGAGQRLPGLTS